MQDQRKSKAQLIKELQELRQKITDSDKTFADRQHADGHQSSEHEPASANRLSTFIAHLPGGILIETPEHKVLQVNQKFCEMFSIDVPPEKLKGADCRESAEQIKHLFTNSEKFIQKIDKILSAGMPELNEELPLKDGRVFERDYVPLKVGPGQVENLWYYRDISERKKAEQKVQESEERYKLLFNSLPYGGELIDRQGNIIDCSPRTAEMMGYQQEELIGKHISAFWSPESLEIFRKKFPELMKGKPQNAELQLVRKDGSLLDVMRAAKPILNDAGQVSSALTLTVDITELKKAEQALKESEQRYRNIINGMYDTAWVIDFNASIVDVNNAATDTLGYSKEELLSMTIADIDHNLKPEMIKELAQKMPTDKIQTFESWHTTKDGKRIPVEIHSSIVTYGEKKAILSIARDITKRIQAESALRESEEKYREVVERANDGIIIIQDGIVKFANARLAILWGGSIDDIIGHPFSEYIHPDERTNILNRYRQRMETGTGETIYETVLIKKNGELINAEINTGFISYKDKPADLVIIRDITERKRAEEEKTQLAEQLRRSQKLETIGTLAGGIAHDFNNILTPIVGYTDMALDDLKESDPLWQDLKQISKASHRAKELVEQILLFAKQGDKEQEPFILQPLVKEALKLLRPSIPVTIEIRQRIDASCGKVLADATQIHQVIINLCTNAWQAMEKEGGILTIELKPVEIDETAASLNPNFYKGEYVRLSVSDSGPGMDKKTLDRIFEPFFTTKAVDKGTGLGLSVVHGIVRSHRGDILVESSPGKGSVFHVYLPVFKAIKKTTRKDSNVITGGHESIIIVDDEEIIANLTKTMLERLGYQVQAFTSSIEALTFLQRHPQKYDLLISDLTMPGMTGLELAGKTQKVRPGFPVMIMTGYGDNLDKETCVKNGIKQVIGKPLEMKKVASAIRRVLDKQSGQK